ncbi:MAG: hypothetical protein K6F68_06405 [Clostridiales bacterium]|nr:hypothetical protein [Clostridiales bacterium]
MNKKSFSILILAALFAVAALVGCTGKSKGIEPGSAFKDDADMAVVVGGKTYKVRTDSAAILAALGDGYAYEETVSCVYKGYDKSFDYGDIKISTVPVDDKDIIEMFTILGGDHATVRGVKVGDSRADVLKAYGESFTSDDGYYITYTQNGDPNEFSAMRVMFRMEGDKVAEICVYSPSYSND